MGNGRGLRRKPVPQLLRQRLTTTNGGGLPRGIDVLPIERQVDTIRIASFNIQVFGEHKLAKPAVMNVLARVMRNFDVIAVQDFGAWARESHKLAVKVAYQDGALKGTAASELKRDSAL